MAVYRPLVSVLLVGRGLQEGAVSVLIALATVGGVLFVAVRWGKPLSRAVAHQSDEIILLSTFGLVLLVAGLAQRLQVSAAVGAFLVGIAVSGPLLGPLSAAYVLLLAILGPILARFVTPRG